MNTITLTNQEMEAVYGGDMPVDDKHRRGSTLLGGYSTVYTGSIFSGWGSWWC